MWIARDKDNRLRLFEGKPTRYKDYWDFCGNNLQLFHDKELIERFDFLKWEDAPIEVQLTLYSNVNALIEESNTIILTKYLGNSYYECEKRRYMFFKMLRTGINERYKDCSDEELEEVWQNHLKTEYDFDEIWDTVQCDGYTKIVLKMGRHDCQHEYDYVCETKEYIDNYIKSKSN